MSDYVVKDNVFLKPSDEYEREFLLRVGYVPYAEEEKLAPKESPKESPKASTTKKATQKKDTDKEEK